MTDEFYEKITLFVVLALLVFLVSGSGSYRTFSATIFCVDSFKCLQTISPALTSGDLFSEISDKILPPVSNVSRPRALAPLERMGLIHRNIVPKTFPIPCPR